MTVVRSKYSRLNSEQYRKFSTSDMYEGDWKGETVSFKREFRGHVFTDEECEALCQCKRVEVHNIRGSRGVYAVQGQLERVDRGFMTIVKFDVIDTVPNNPNFQFGMPLYDLNPVHRLEEDDDVVLNDDDLEGIYFGDMADIWKTVAQYQEQREMAESASKAALEDTDEDLYQDLDAQSVEASYANIADDNPYGDFTDEELAILSSDESVVVEEPLPDMGESSYYGVSDFTDDDYDDFDDEDFMLPDMSTED